MKEVNLYWPVYRNLEREVTKLSEDIHFSDDQINVYSIKIADLITRCSMEIEPIAKDIYRNETMKEPRNAGESISYMNETWLLSKKQTVISAVHFYFLEEFRPSFAPFDYVKESDNDYYKAYCAIKHDRVKNLRKANINILIRSLAALYLLNIYYRNETFTAKSISTINSDFDISLGSDIFSIKMMKDTCFSQIHGQAERSPERDNSGYVYATNYPQRFPTIFGKSTKNHYKSKEMP